MSTRKNKTYANGGKIPWEASFKLEPVQTMTGQAVSRAAIDTQFCFR